MHKQIIHISTFLACFAFHFVSAQTAPKNPNIFTLQEVIDRPTVGWTVPFDKSWGAGGIQIELVKGIQVATQKFVKGKKIYIKDATPLNLAALQKMNFVGDYVTGIDIENGGERSTPILSDKQGVAKTFRIEGQYFFDKAQNSMGFVADKIHLASDKGGVCVENMIVNYKQRPQHLTPVSVADGNIYMPFQPERYIENYMLEPLRKKSAGAKMEKNNNWVAISDAEIQQYSDVMPMSFKSELYWDETTQQFGLFVETFSFQMRYFKYPDYAGGVQNKFEKPAAH